MVVVRNGEGRERNSAVTAESGRRAVAEVGGGGCDTILEEVYGGAKVGER